MAAGKKINNKYDNETSFAVTNMTGPRSEHWGMERALPKTGETVLYQFWCSSDE
jgi:hypothetical protein